MYIWSQLPVSSSLLLVIPPEQKGWHFASPDTLPRASANPELEPSPPREPTRTAGFFLCFARGFWEKHDCVRGSKCAQRGNEKGACVPVAGFQHPAQHFKWSVCYQCCLSGLIRNRPLTAYWNGEKGPHWLQQASEQAPMSSPDPSQAIWKHGL